MDIIFLTYSTDVWQTFESYALEGVSRSLKSAQAVVHDIFKSGGDEVKALIVATELDSNVFYDVEVHDFEYGIEWHSDEAVVIEMVGSR